MMSHNGDAENVAYPASRNWREKATARTTSVVNCREIEGAIDNAKWTEQDKWIYETWQQVLHELPPQSLSVEESAVDRRRCLCRCRLSMQDREEVVALIVESIRSNQEVQRALLEWAWRRPQPARHP